MSRDGFIGVKNLHLAKMTNVDSLTYATPVAIPGTVQMQASRNTSNDPSYADDEVWIDSENDTGGEGTISIRDVLSSETVRNLIAELCGYFITAEGDLLALTNADKAPCAIMCERTAYSGHGQRKLWYKAYLGKPSFDAATKEDKKTIGQLDIPFRYEPVTLGEGVTCTTRDSFYGNSTYSSFFSAVVKTYAAPSTSGSGTSS